MTIILFLIDTSASMSQEAYVNGVHKSYLDVAKGAVETFLKYRQRSQDCMGDRYMLLTFEDHPNNIKAGWKENHATFMNELKNLQSNGLTTMGEALKGAFDLLNLNRMQSGIDTYGQGRCPFYLEPSIIILITDGGRYSHRNGTDSQLSLPLNVNIPGAKLTKEPFRWDQRLFSLILRISGHKGDERVEGKVPHDDSPLEKMCEVTGGRSYKIRSQYVLNQCIESLVQKAQPGVVINFDPVFKEQKEIKEGELPEMVFQNMKKMIFVPKIPNIKSFPIGYWPLPESYWPDVKMTSLPPRDAHPRIKISLMSQDEPAIVRNFPIDKYELEGSPLTLWILSKKDPNKVFPLIVVNSNGGSMHDPMSPYRMHQSLTNDAPFGYLKANSTSMVVHFYVLPYNFQYLLPLLFELVHKLNSNPTSEWINKFATYVKNIPQYYCPFLRKSLSMINIPYQLLQYILPESLDSYLSPTVANQLKQMKNMAKQDQENLCLRVFKQLKQPKMPYHQHETVKLNSGQPLKTTELVKHPMLRETFQKIHSEINIFENYNIVVPTVTQIQSTKNYRNPFDIPRRDLIDEIARMRDNFFKLPTCNINLLSMDAGHSLPIAEMGNYQEYLKRRETPLREIEPTNVRQHMFGNPYKRDKHMVMVDEADDGISGIDPSTSNNNPKMQNPNKKDLSMRMSRKRKAGPIRKDFIYKRARFDFGFPLSPGLPCPPSPASSSSDIDSDDTSSEASFALEDEDTRSDYSELSIDEDYNNKKNGYAFDNMLNETNNVEPLSPPTPPALQQYPLFPTPSVLGVPSLPLASIPLTRPTQGKNSAFLSQNFTNLIPIILVIGLTRLNLQQLDQQQPHFTQTYPFHFQMPQATSEIVPTVPNNVDLIAATTLPPISIAITTSSALNSQPMPTSPTGPPPPFPPPLSSIPAIATTTTTTTTTSAPTPSTQTPPAVTTTQRSIPNNNNDLNDAQNISKILQSLHNGSTSSSSITVANHNNDKGKHDEVLTVQVNNNKEEKLNNEKQQHHRAKRKSQQPAASKPATVQQKKSTSHVHTNGLVTEKKSNNRVANGDDTILDDEVAEKTKEENLEVRSSVFREIRKLGRDYSGIYEQLAKVKGTFEVRFNFMQMCIDEATRFRRKHMADCIQEWWLSKCDENDVVEQKTGNNKKK